MIIEKQTRTAVIAGIIKIITGMLMEERTSEQHL